MMSVSVFCDSTPAFVLPESSKQPEASSARSGRRTIARRAGRRRSLSRSATRPASDRCRWWFMRRGYAYACRPSTVLTLLRSRRNRCEPSAVLCDDRGMALAIVHRSQLSRYAWLCLAVLGIAVGVVSLAIARHDPDGSFAGGSVRDGTLELAAGWSLML